MNGTASLIAPRMFARRIGVDPDTNGPALYALRLFGVRTVLIGAQLLGREGEARRRAVRVAPLVHATDALAALVGGMTGHLPASGARKAVVVSAVNTMLALVARSGSPEGVGQPRSRSVEAGNSASTGGTS